MARVAWLVEHLSSMHKSLCLISAPYKLGVMVGLEPQILGGKSRRIKNSKSIELHREM